MKRLVMCLMLILAFVIPTVAHADSPSMWVSFITPKVEGRIFVATAIIMSNTGEVKGATVVYDVIYRAETNVTGEFSVIGTVTATEKKAGYVGKFNIRSYGVGSYRFKVVSVACPGYTWNGVPDYCGVQILR